MYRVRKKNIDRKPAKPTSWVTSAAASPLIRKIDSGTSGLRLRCSLTTNATSSARRRRARPSCARRPSRGPGPSPARRPAAACRRSPARRRGGRSSRAARGAGRRDQRGRCRPSTSTAAIGLTNSTQRQPGPSVSTPPRKTPAADARPRHRRPRPRAPWCGPALLEGRGQERQRGRQHHRRADALREAGADQHARAAGEAADQRESPNSAVPATRTRRRPNRSAGAAAEQHEAAVGEQVAAEHPLQALQREAEVAADRGKRDVDDRRVDEVEELDRAQQRQRQLAAAGGEEGRLGGCRRPISETSRRFRSSGLRWCARTAVLTS